MKKIIITINILFLFCFANSLEINNTNYQEYENKEIIFMPIDAIRSYKIGKFSFQPYELSQDKNAKVKKILSKKEIIYLTLDIPLRNSTKTIKVKGDKIIIENMELKEIADKKNFERELKLNERFLNKKIISNYSEIYTIRDISRLTERNKYAEFPIYKLEINEGQYIYLKGPSYDLPKEYVLLNKEGIAPSLYKKQIDEDKLEKIITKQFLNKLQTDIGSVYFYIIEKSKKNIKSFNLEIDFYYTKWLFINSVYLYLDGKKEKLNIGQYHREVNDGILEYFYFPTSKEQIKKIINSKEVILRLSGDEYYIDAKFTPQNFYNFRRFYNEEMK